MSHHRLCRSLDVRLGRGFHVRRSVVRPDQSPGVGYVNWESTVSPKVRKEP